MTELPILSEFQQDEVWENWLSAEVRTNYFADLAQRFDFQQKALNLSTLVISSGACYTAFAGVGHNLIAILALIAAALSAGSLVQQNQKRVTDALDLQFRWHRISGRISFAVERHVR